MSKFLISISLILSSILGGLMLTAPTINVSAAYDEKKCIYNGQFIDASMSDRQCKPCPIDFYCQKIAVLNSDGTQAKDVNGIPFFRSPEKPGRDGSLNSEVKACPSGTTTKGNTSSYKDDSLVTVDKDGLIVGTFGSNIGACRAPNFTCPAETPVFTKRGDLTGCYIQCEAGFDEIFNGKTVTCLKPQVACTNNQVAVNKVCKDKCPDGSIVVINEIVQACKSTSSSSSTISSSSSSTPPLAPCPIPGQVRSYGTCACPLPNYAVQESNGSKSCKTCPVGNTIVQVGVEQTGEIIYKCEAPAPQNNGGGSDFWTYAGIAIGAYALIDGFTCGGLFNFGNCGSPATAVVTPTNTEVFSPVYQPSTTICPLDKRPQSTNNGTICVCEYGTVDFYGNCGVEIDVPAPNIPSRKKATDGAEYSFVNDDQLYAFEGSNYGSYNTVSDNFYSFVPNQDQYNFSETDLYSNYTPIAFDNGYSNYFASSNLDSNYGSYNTASDNLYSFASDTYDYYNI
jgi:hypothetical protein